MHCDLRCRTLLLGDDHSADHRLAEVLQERHKMLLVSPPSDDEQLRYFWNERPQYVHVFPGAFEVLLPLHGDRDRREDRSVVAALPDRPLGDEMIYGPQLQFASSVDQLVGDLPWTTCPYIGD